MSTARFYILRYNRYKQMGQGQSQSQSESNSVNSSVIANAKEDINMINSKKRNSNAANSMSTPNGLGVAPQAGGKKKSRRSHRRRHRRSHKTRR